MRATTSFEEVLESCLQELARTSDVESCLRHHPRHAEQLRPLLEAADMMRDHYRVVPQAPGGLAAGRERFLAVAAQERARAVPEASDTGKRFQMEGRGMRLSFARLLPILLVALLGATILGGGVIWAAQDSLPGELLYPVKLAVEEAHLALASAPGGQVDVALGLVDERVEELQALAAAGRAVPEETVSRMERHIERALTQTAGADAEEMEGLLAQVAERTHTQTQRLEQVLSQAPEQTRGEFRRAVAACRAGAEAAEAGLQDPGTFRWRYRHREGEPEPTPEREREGEGTPVGTPSATPQGPRATTEPQPTPKRLQGTAEATGTPQRPRATTAPQATTAETQAAPTAQGSKATGTPQGTMQGPGATPTSHGPEMTAAPQATPQSPQPTAKSQATPQQGPQPTSMPQATSQGPQPTSMPQVTSEEPEGTPGHQGGTPGGGQEEP